MGSRTTDTVTEIDEIRERLERQLSELGTRLPPIAQWGRRALGGVGGGLLLFVLGRARARAKTSRKTKKGAAPPPSVVVRPGLSTPAALGVASIWAAVRLYEARTRAETGRGRGPAVVREMPSERRA